MNEAVGILSYVASKATVFGTILFSMINDDGVILIFILILWFLRFGVIDGMKK